MKTTKKTTKPRRTNPYQPISSGPGKGYFIIGPRGWESFKCDFGLD